MISALMCLAGLAYGANIQRVARDTEAIFPTIVEEILKVELQSDLMKNSAVEAIENEPIISMLKEEIIVEPIASRLVEDGGVLAEEKKPEIVEVLAVKEIIPEPLAAVRNTEPLPEIVEKVEIVAIQENAEKPVDNFRTESVPSVEEPIAEIIKETVVVEPVVELRQEPVAVVEIKEEEIVKPMLRNVIKEEIPQVEELRNIAPVEMDAVKEILPEPVASSNIVEPIVEIEQQVKNIDEVPAFKEIKPETPMIEEMKIEAEIPAAIMPEMKLEEVKAKVESLLTTELKEEKVEAEIKKTPEIAEMTEVVASPEIKPLTEEVVVVEGLDSQIRQSDRPTIVQQVQDAFAQVPIVGQIFNRNPADETVSDEATTRPNLIQAAQAAVQQAVQNTQNAFQNVFAPTSNSVASVDGDSTTTRPGPIAAVINLASDAFQNVANIINPGRPTTTAAPAKEEVKPTVVDEKPVKADTQVKTVESAPVVEPLVVAQNEVSETQKVVEEEKENLVKN